MLIVGCGSDFIKLDINNLIDRGGLMYAPNDDEPFTGSVFDFYDNGQRKFDGRYRKGLMHGKWTYYHENGQKFGEGTWKNGELDGIHTNWYENGQKKSKVTYKNGKADGLRTGWYENGQKMIEGTYKNLKLDGELTTWFENVQKSLEFNYELGDITKEKIVAEFEFLIYKDDAKYRADKKAAIREVPYYFERKDDIKEVQSSRIFELLTVLQKVRSARQNLKEAQQQWWEAGGKDGGHDPDYFARVQARVKTDSASLSQELSNFNASYPFDLSNSEWREFLGNGEPTADRINYEEFAISIVNISRGLWTHGILSINKKNIQSDVIDIVYEGIHDENLNKNDFLDIPEALGKARIELESSYLDPNDIRRTVGTKIVGEFLRPNLIFDRDKTQAEQSNKRALVSQAIGFIFKNERIVDANTRITPEHLQKIKSYIRAWQDKNEKMSVEETYKDGKWVSEKCWDEDGNEIDCDELE